MFLKEKFLSELLGRIVVDLSGDKVGKIIDVVADIGDEFPKIEGIIIGRLPKKYYCRWEDIIVITKNFISLNLFKNKLTSADDYIDNLWLSRDIFDKQIIDTEGKRLVRVNDLRLVRTNNEVRLIAAEVGFSGILRRLGIRKFLEKIFRYLGIKLSDTLIPWDSLEILKTDIPHLKLTTGHPKLSKLHPSDVAEIVSHLDKKERISVFSHLDKEVAAETLHELKPDVQASIVEELDEEVASDILETMPSDEAADVLGDLPEEKTQELLTLMEKDEAEDVKELLQYDDHTAGGLMTTEFITFPYNITAEEVINKLRELAPSAEMIYYLYIVDEEKRLVGVLSLRDLIVATPQTIISNFIRKELISIEVHMDKQEVANIISKYNFLALPVVDENKKIVGIITIDDVIDLVVPPLSKKRKYI